MVRDIDRRRFLRRTGAAGAVGLAGCMGDDGDGDETDGQMDGNATNETDGQMDGNETGDEMEDGDADDYAGPDVLNVIGYPKSGIQIFKDFYTNFPDTAEVIVPDGLQNTDLPSQVGHTMDDVIGTAPGAAGPNQQAFRDMYRDEYGRAASVFTAHTYDATAVVLLANAAAGENTGEAIRDQMRRVANGPGEEYGPGELAEAAAAAADGDDVTYEGASSSVDFDENGDPASATYDVWRFAEAAEDAEEEYTTETVDSTSFEAEPGGPMADEAPGGTGREIMVGVLLPETGDLSPLGEPMIDAAELAIQEVNDGDVDLTVDHQVQDTQTNQSGAISGAEALVNGGYPAIVGPASSPNNLAVVENVAIPNKIVGCSPSSTALSVSLLEDDDYVFRTAPSDLLQGQVMAQVASERLDGETASTFHLNQQYGQQLADQFASTFTEEYGGEIYHKVSFEGEQSSYTAKLQQALSSAN
mgnify:CR=1 FL=1